MNLDDDQKRVLPKIEALLRLADRNPNAEEAASAAKKAQDLLIAYNLDASLVGNGDEGGKRVDDKVRGGFYQYQRDLWESVAILNFCFHFVSWRLDKIVKKRKRSDGTTYEVKDEKWTRCHRLVGKKVNVAATIAMSTYLEQAIEHLVEDRITGQNNLRFSNYIMSYREGATSTIVNKLYERRQEVLSEERRREQEAREADIAAGRRGVSTATGLTVASVEQSERDANADFIAGEEGWSARKRAERSAAAAARVAAERAYTEWAAANPEQARAQEEKARKEEEARDKRNAARRTGYSRGYGGSSGGKEINSGAFYAGRDAAENISLDQQMGERAVKGRLR